MITDVVVNEVKLHVVVQLELTRDRLNLKRGIRGQTSPCQKLHVSDRQVNAITGGPGRRSSIMHDGRLWPTTESHIPLRMRSQLTNLTEVHGVTQVPF